MQAVTRLIVLGLWLLPSSITAFVPSSTLPVARTSSLLSAKKPKKKNQASSTKGFGKPPPTLEEIADSYPNRLPESLDVDCACGSGASYVSCCRPYHIGTQRPESASKVLQTRYSAFSYRIPLYILETTHPECRDYREDRFAWLKDLNKSGMFDSFEFEMLEPTAAVEEAGEAFIDFQVHLRRKSSDERMVLRERSRFLQEQDDVWKYAGGEVQANVAGLEDVVLNN